MRNVSSSRSHCQRGSYWRCCSRHHSRLGSLSDLPATLQPGADASFAISVARRKPFSSLHRHWNSAHANIRFRESEFRRRAGGRCSCSIRCRTAIHVTFRRHLPSIRLGSGRSADEVHVTVLDPETTSTPWRFQSGHCSGSDSFGKCAFSSTLKPGETSFDGLSRRLRRVQRRRRLQSVRSNTR